MYKLPFPIFLFPFFYFHFFLLFSFHPPFPPPLLIHSLLIHRLCPSFPSDPLAPYPAELPPASTAPRPADRQPLHPVSLSTAGGDLDLARASMDPRRRPRLRPPASPSSRRRAPRISTYLLCPFSPARSSGLRRKDLVPPPRARPLRPLSRYAVVRRCCRGRRRRTLSSAGPTQGQRLEKRWAGEAELVFRGSVLTVETRNNLRSASVRTYTFFTTG
jgi:hypothetical protein